MEFLIGALVSGYLLFWFLSFMLFTYMASHDDDMKNMKNELNIPEWWVKICFLLMTMVWPLLLIVIFVKKHNKGK